MRYIAEVVGARYPQVARELADYAEEMERAQTPESKKTLEETATNPRHQAD